MSQMDKCLKFKVILWDKSDCILYKIIPQNAMNFRHLSSCGTIEGMLHSQSLSDPVSPSLAVLSSSKLSTFHSIPEHSVSVPNTTRSNIEKPSESLHIHRSKDME